MKRICFLVLAFSHLNAFAQQITTRFETSGGRETPTYFEIIDWWQRLDQRYAVFIFYDIPGKQHTRVNAVRFTRMNTIIN